MRPTPEPSPIGGKALMLSEKLFDDDAVILDRVSSKSVRYAADRGPSIEMASDGFQNSASGRSPAGCRSCVSSPGTGLPARWISTANSPRSPD